MAIKDDIVGPARLVFVGDDKGLEFEVFAQSGSQTGEEAVAAGVMQNASAFALRFEVRKEPTTRDPALIIKTSDDGISVTGTFNAARGSNTQRVVVALADTDTQSLQARAYQYTLKRTDAGFETTLAYGAFALVKGTVR